MTTMASQITSLTVVYSTIYSDPDQRKHESSASLAFVWGIHRDRWIHRTKGQLRGKCFHLMTSSWCTVIMPHMLFSFGITNWNDWFTCFRQIKIETVKEHRQYKNTYTVILLQPGKTENGHVKSVIFVRASGGALFSVKKGQGWELRILWRDYQNKRWYSRVFYTSSGIIL